MSIFVERGKPADTENNLTEHVRREQTQHTQINDKLNRHKPTLNKPHPHKSTTNSTHKNQQQTQPTQINNKLNPHIAPGRNWTRDALLEGKRSHHCAIPAPRASLRKSQVNLASSQNF